MERGDEKQVHGVRREVQQRVVAVEVVQREGVVLVVGLRLFVIVALGVGLRL